MQKYIKTIRCSAALGLWGSMGIIILTAFYHLVSPYRFYPSEYTARWMLVVGTVLAVSEMGSSLRFIHKRIPVLRQLDSLETKFRGYAQHIRILYIFRLAVVFLICCLIVLSARIELLMLAMVATLMLILTYPNIYRIKVDLGLTDEEMKSLFGDRYIPDTKDDNDAA